MPSPETRPAVGLRPRTPAPAEADGEPSGDRLDRWLGSPAMDRVIAVIACLPFLYATHRRLGRGTVDVVTVNLTLQFVVLVVTMVLRRAPSRVTRNPWFWLLTLVATYWSFLTGSLITRGVALAPRWVPVSLSFLGLGILVYARLSLGRSIGFVPAQRPIVTSGAYALVRHPIYTGVFVNYLAFSLSYFTLGNVVIAALGCFWFVLKSLVEEQFLAKDPDYAAYLRRVRWRWIPWVA